MKKLIIVLLVVILSLGLSGIAFADTSGSDTQSISAQISGSLALTVPTALSGWIFSATGANTTQDDTSPTTGSCTAMVQTNAPYNLTVKASATLPAGEVTADVYMTTSYDGAPATATSADLTEPFKLKYSSAGDSGANNTSAGANYGSLNTVYTTANTFVTAANAPDSGQASIGIQFGQITSLADAAYYSATQLTYQIQLTWTASATLL